MKQSPANRRITAQTIAEHLGLSQPTVSRALSIQHAHKVAPETRDRIIAYARQMGYRPNMLASALRSQRTGIVGFYSGYGYVGPDDDFLTHIIGGLQRATSERHMDLLLHGVHGGHTAEEIMAKLMDGRIDGVFLHTAPDHPIATALAKERLPVVAIADVVPEIPSVLVADADGIRRMLDYLWRKGHREIAYIAPEIHLASVEERCETYQAYLSERGIVPNILRVGMNDYEGALNQLLMLHPRPTAVCCWNDMFAYGLLRTRRNSKSPNPLELAISGFDGFLDNKFPAEQLTTVIAPWHRIATEACRLLADQIEGRTVSLQTILPCELHIGGTA